MKSLIWTLAKSGEREVLRIKFRGKNYETNSMKTASPILKRATRQATRRWRRRHREFDSPRVRIRRASIWQLAKSFKR